ncbi:MAG: filamentous hemagglutinin N-terminal domain-containing protein [Fischerella sp. CENA71]|nr:filamentous hemagglutinin N-terminal domain-containing protein [Fischerella sp. CENA71]
MRSLFFTLSLLSLGFFASINTVRAQVSSDGSLSTTVSSPDGSNFTIDNGNRAGGNLFHSFSQFSVPNGGSAVFQNSPDVQNIISRVTGGSISNIDGLIRAQGSANLFLLNPAGIAFGPNASLNIGGSFFATTANSLLFGDGVEFSATNLATPPVLTVNIPIGLRFRDNPVSISNQLAFLQVPSQKTLALVGGNVNIDSGILFAPGGRVELGGLTQAGTVGLNPDNSLNFPDGVARGDVSITNGLVDVSAGNGGSIAVNARNIEILEGSQLITGIRSGLGSPDSQAGDMNLNATGTITAKEASRISNIVQSNAKGNAGNINVIAQSLSLTDGTQISAATFGKGNAGNITIQARDISFEGIDSNGFSSGAFSSVERGAEGSGGKINITQTKSLSLRNGARISTSTLGTGNAGDITINTDQLFLDGFNRNGVTSIVNNVENTGIGQGGNINIKASSLFATNGAQISAAIFGTGNAGNINIDADSITLDGVGSNRFGSFSSGIYGTVEPTGNGNGGNISISTQTLSTKNGARINTSTSKKGSAGSITINASNIEIAGVSEPNSNDIFSRSGIFSSVNRGAIGNAGNIEITTGSLFVTDGGQISASTSGRGKAGSITINAPNGTVSFDGTDNIVGFASAAFSSVEAGGVGNGGDINIIAKSLSLTNGGNLNAFVRGTSGRIPGGIGDAGDVKLNISDTIRISGVSDILASNGIFSRSGIFSSVNRGAIGNAGNIEITTGSLFVTDGGQISASTFGRGSAGSITINAPNGTVSFDGTDNIVGLRFPSAAFSTVEAGGVGNGGDIKITARSLYLTNSGELNTFIRRGGNGTAGNVKLNISDTINIAGANSGIFSDVLAGGTGNGGNIEIYKGSLFVSDGGKITASTAGNGNAGGIKINANSLFVDGGKLITNSEVENRQAGNIEITTAKDIRLDNQALISAETKSGQGNITLNSRDLILRDHSNITTNATGTATGGNITIRTGNLVAFPKEDSNISASAEEGPGGRVSIRATRIFGIEFREKPTKKSDITVTSNLGPDFSGTVQINSLDVDPSQGLVQLPNNLADVSNQIAQNPCQKGAGSSFTVNGRGGFPSSPDDGFRSNETRIDLVEPVASSSSSQSSTINQPTTQPTAKQIIPAQGWIFNDKGEVVLTAYDPTNISTAQRSSKTTATCNARF